MRLNPLLTLWLAIACALTFVSAPSARAQCGVNSLGYGDVGIVSGNPFQAEIVVIRSRATALSSAIPPRLPELVARDSAGRVRVERVSGEFQYDNGPDAGTKTLQHRITICDPVAQTMTEINTLDATAKIVHSRPSAPSSSRLQPVQTRTFCSSRLLLGRDGRIKREDLGDQTIEGVVAHGVRIFMPMLGAPDGGESAQGENTTERWCSDDLSALVLTTSENPRSGVKSSVGMQKIERAEPDPSLFQIPPNYAVTESVAEPSKQATTPPVNNQP